MVAVAIIGTALGGGVPGPSYGLYVAGLDVRLKGDTSSNRYGTPLDSITVTENGPGGVSSMSFRVEDPMSEVTVMNGDPVFYVNQTNSVPEFRGWVQHFTTTPFGLGRAYDVECIGVEAVLDWITVPAMTFAAQTAIPDAVQMALAAGITPGGFALNTAWTNDENGSLAFPQGDLSTAAVGNTYAYLNAALSITTCTLREAIRQLVAEAYANDIGGSPIPLDRATVWTVDFWWGLRLWRSGFVPSDYALLSIIDTAAGAVQAADLQHETDGTGVIRGVYIVGGNAAGTGVVPDGSGITGPIATLEDSTILTAADRDVAGKAYLADKAQALRGTFTQQTFTDTSTTSAHVQAGSRLNITDAQVGLVGISGGAYSISAITKTYHGGNLETWQITYGGLPPSLPRALRRLTRAVRN